MSRASEKWREWGRAELLSSFSNTSVHPLPRRIPEKWQMLKRQNVPWRTVSHGTLRVFCLCVQETKRFSLTTTRRQKNENYKTTKLLFKVLNIPLTYFVKCRRLSWSGIPRPISKFIKKEIKFRRCLFTFPIKCEIMPFCSVVVQNKNIQISVMHVRSCCFAY